MVNSQVHFNFEFPTGIKCPSPSEHATIPVWGNLPIKSSWSMRTWAFVGSDAAVVMPDWVIRRTETSSDADGSTWSRIWRFASRRARGTTFPPLTTSVALCQPTDLLYSVSG